MAIQPNDILTVVRSMLWRNHWYKNECACNHNWVFSFQIHLRIPNANTNLRIRLCKLFPQLMKSWRFYGWFKCAFAKKYHFFVNSNHIFQHELNNNVIIFATHNLKMRITDAKENHSNARFHCQTCPSLKLMIKTNAIFAVAKFYTTYLIRF